MTLSVQTTNALSRAGLIAAFESTTCALAGAIIDPIGVAGGALFGAVRCLSQIPLISCGQKFLNTEDPQASEAAKTVAKALQIFGSYAIAWGVLALAGFSLSLFHVVALGIVSTALSFFVEVALGCVGVHFRRAIQ